MLNPFIHPEKKPFQRYQIAHTEITSSVIFYSSLTSVFKRGWIFFFTIPFIDSILVLFINGGNAAATALIASLVCALVRIRATDAGLTALFRPKEIP
jgi:hypothetical protein